MRSQVQFIVALCAIFGNQCMEAATLPRQRQMRRFSPLQKQEEEQNNGEGLEVAQSGNQNDNLPEAKDASVENYYKIKASDLALGTDFLSGPYGKLFVLYVKSMVDFFAYYSRVIDGVGQTSHQGGQARRGPDGGRRRCGTAGERGQAAPARLQHGRLRLRVRQQPGQPLLSRGGGPRAPGGRRGAAHARPGQGARRHRRLQDPRETQAGDSRAGATNFTGILSRVRVSYYHTRSASTS